jgi:CHAT domain-containing protein/tetratricopeptide (TPR) repeat protein
MRRALPDARTQLILQQQANRQLTEVDLWVPLMLVHKQELHEIMEAGLTVDAWLDLAERLGRRDVLLLAAGSALSIAGRQFPPERLADVSGKWVALSSIPHSSHGAAVVAREHANLLFLLERNEDALRSYREARTLYNAINDTHGIGSTWLGEAWVLSRFGPNDGALTAYRQARALFLESGDRRMQGHTWVGEARMLLPRGQHAGAMHAFRQARLLFGGVGYERGQASAWFGEALVLHLLERDQEALNAMRQIRALFANMSDEYGQGYTWLSEANLQYQVGNHEGALHAYYQARTLLENVGDKKGQGFAWSGAGNVLLHFGRYNTALNAYRHARRLFVDTGNAHGQGVTWFGEAQVWVQQGNFDLALRAAEKAIRFAKAAGISRHEPFVHLGEARILLASNRELQAILRAKDALALLRLWRQSGVSDIDSTARANWSEPYDFLIPLLLRKGNAHREQALLLVEAAHAPVLLDLLATDNRHTDDIDDKDLLMERKHLQAERSRLERELNDMVEPNKREKLRQKLEWVDLQLELNQFIASGQLRSRVANGSPIDAQTRQALVRDVGAVLLYYVAGDETFAFLLHPGRQSSEIRRINLSRNQLRQEVQILRHDMSNYLWESRALARRRALFEQLVAPFAGALAGASRVTIIPHGPLHELPFEGLLDATDTPLFERWHVTIAPSLSTLHTLRERRARRQQSPQEIEFLGIAGGTGLSLPHHEVTEVGAAFRPSQRIATQSASSRGAYEEQAPHARHILISSHGKHVAQSRSGYLELTASDGVATRLTAGEIAHIPLRAELVTLAACETARGEAMQSDERLDLTRAFLIAGADAVLATRWRVPEHPSTRQFLLDFYQALHQGGPGGTRLRKDEALTQARRRSRARGDQAQLWAAWVLVGDAR